MNRRRDDNRVLAALWAAVDLYRVLVLGYVVYLYLARLPDVAHPMRGWWILAALGAWTVASLFVRHRGRCWYLAELALAAGAISASLLVDSPEAIAAGSPTVPGMWPAATVLSWAVRAGAPGGLAAAGVIAVADLVVIRVPNPTTVHHIVILLLLGACVGYCADLVRQGHAALREAVVVRARIAERERLAATVHDGVLQALSLIHRRGSELGGEAARLGALAGEQERVLRDLVSAPALVSSTSLVPVPDGPVDVRTLVAGHCGGRVSVSAPADPVLVPAVRAQELDAAVLAVLDNVRLHAGEQARAWVLLEDEGDTVCVTVRDDGPGIPDGRLEEARREGRLGVASSIMGRMTELGGSATYTSRPGGTVVELQMPIEREPS